MAKNTNLTEEQIDIFYRDVANSKLMIHNADLRIMRLIGEETIEKLEGIPRYTADRSVPLDVDFVDLNFQYLPGHRFFGLNIDQFATWDTVLRAISYYRREATRAVKTYTGIKQMQGRDNQNWSPKNYNQHLIAYADWYRQLRKENQETYLQSLMGAEENASKGQSIVFREYDKTLFPGKFDPMKEFRKLRDEARARERARFADKDNVESWQPW